jgi:hypothetical protein
MVKGSGKKAATSARMLAAPLRSWIREQMELGRDPSLKALQARVKKMKGQGLKTDGVDLKRLLANTRARTSSRHQKDKEKTEKTERPKKPARESCLQA